MKLFMKMKLIRELVALSDPVSEAEVQISKLFKKGAFYTAHGLAVDVIELTDNHSEGMAQGLTECIEDSTDGAVDESEALEEKDDEVRPFRGFNNGKLTARDRFSLDSESNEGDHDE